MNVDNFMVRNKRRLVEKYQAKSAWSTLDAAALGELSGEVAGLPSELDPEDQESKRFDLLVLKLQLAVLTSDPIVARLGEQVKGIAALLEEKSSIPLVQQQLALIQDLQSDEWWENVTADMLENVRRRLRGLIKLIDKQQRKPIYTNFEDQLGTEDHRERRTSRLHIVVGEDEITIEARANAALSMMAESRPTPVEITRGEVGAPRRIRTYDHRIRSPVLYPTELGARGRERPRGLSSLTRASSRRSRGSDRSRSKKTLTLVSRPVPSLLLDFGLFRGRLPQICGYSSN
jgi:hypothetical protein